jgi:uncharacterized integral membrane protein (TIGR00698 family)
MTGAGAPSQTSPIQAWVREHAPGLVLTAVVACAAWGLRRVEALSQFSPLILALLLGAALRSLMEIPAAARPGMVFGQRRLLRTAIVLLGLQLSLGRLAALGLPGLGVSAAALVVTFAFTLWLGRAMGVEGRLSALIAGGCSVCGASAVTSFNTVAQADDADVCYAMAVVTLFGAVAMLALPLAAGSLGLSERAFGLWAGASIHEVAQVAGAALPQGEVAGETAMVAKFARVLLLAPLVMLFAWGLRRRGGGARAKVQPPWFLAGFLGMAALSTVTGPTAAVLDLASQVTSVLMTLALAAMGLDTDLGKLREKGLRPLGLAAASSVCIAGVSLVLVRAVG